MRTRRSKNLRYTVDASVFVNAFNPHEEGHVESLAILAAIQHGGDPLIVPMLLLPEIASAVARASDDNAGALQYAHATAALPHVTLVSLTSTMARHAAELAAPAIGCVAPTPYTSLSLEGTERLWCRETRNSVRVGPLS